jgi:hypothetical protein
MNFSTKTQRRLLKSNARACIGFAILISSVIPHLLGQERAFSVSGHVKSTFATLNGNVGSIGNEFTVLVVGCQSVIRATNVSDMAINYIEFGCSPDESYNLIQYNSDPSETNVINSANLELYPSASPESPAGLIVPLWLAYASKCYYQAQTNGMVFPMSYLSTTYRAVELRLPAIWHFSDSSPNLLQDMTEYTDGNEYSIEEGKVLAKRLPQELQNRQTNCSFQVLSWTNVASLHLPKDFILRVFEPDSSAKTMKLSFTMEGFGTQFHEYETFDSSQLKLKAPRKTRVTDKRFYIDGKRIRPIVYLSEDGEIKSREAIMASQKYTDAIMDFREKQPTFNSISKIIMALLIIIGILPIFAFILLRSRNQTKTNATKQ